jgi:glutamate racemase
MESKDTRSGPIGVFDSGVGGLSILTEIRKLLPPEDLIYFADSAHCPYGVKPVDEIRQRTLEVTDFLVSLGAKAVVVACNSACEAGLGRIRDKYPVLPIVGVEPAVKPAHQETRNGKIGVLATSLTLNGERFSNLVAKYAAGVEVFSQPAPGLVELVEAGKLDTAEAETMLHQYLDPLLEKGIDTLVLCCTHYPFLAPIMRKICGAGVVIIDTGLAVARQTRRILEENDLLSISNYPGRETFYTSGDPEIVKRNVEKLWQGNRIVVNKVII